MPSWYNQESNTFDNTEAFGVRRQDIDGRLYSAVTETVADSLRQPNSLESFALAVTCFKDAYLVSQVSYFSPLRYRLDIFDALIANNERHGISIDTSIP